MANSNINNYIKDGRLASSRMNPVVTNAPSGTVPIHTKYNDETAAYYDTYAQYADNVFDAEMQGLDYADFYKWTKVRIRSSNVVDATTGENLSIAWQKILILDKHIDFVPIGAYLKYNNATWIVFNPDNIASSTGGAIVIRCNQTYNTLDYYGNIVKTPMFIAKGTILASSPYYMEYSATIDGYQHVIMQLNEVTEKITNNTRIILGKSAFGMYGVSDFPEEFTGDMNTCHILRADLRLQETIEADDLINHVADKKHFSFKIHIGASDTMREGGTQQLTVDAYRENEKIQSTEDAPLTYLWSSSDENVATVDEDGIVTAIGEGYCQITCTLKENPNVTDACGINVLVSSEPYIDFTSPVPDKVKVYTTFEITAAYYENGQPTDNIVEWTLRRADRDAYSYTVSGNTVSVMTYAPSESPLEVYATYSGATAVKKIQIIGY